MCPRSSGPFYIVTYYMKWVTVVLGTERTSLNAPDNSFAGIIGKVSLQAI